MPPSPAPPPGAAAIRRAWIAAADADDLDAGIAAVEAMGRAHEPGSEEARLAERAVDDLIVLRESRWLGRPAVEPDPAAWHAAHADALRYGSDDRRVDAAVLALGGGRDAASVTALVDADRLVERDQRHARLRLLWRMAADLPGSEEADRARDALERSLSAPAPGEAALARRALDDLERVDRALELAEASLPLEASEIGQPAW